MSEDAAFRLAQVLEARGLEIAKRALELLRDGNEGRSRLADLRRLSDVHVEEVLDGKD